MQDFFDAVNVHLIQNPDLLEQLSFLFWLKTRLLMLLMGYFLFLVYREDWRAWRQRKTQQAQAEAEARLAA